jgi:Cu2+-containing amine oxidase
MAKPAAAGRCSSPKKQTPSVRAGLQALRHALLVILLQPGSTVAQCRGVAEKHIWVPAFDPSWRYASGDYPNVHPCGDSLPKYVAQSRPI